MTTETMNADHGHTGTLHTERGLLLAVLVMVVLGVGGMFLMSA